jgi:glycosyltransferase involved in cell wall biosynthesis
MNALPFEVLLATAATAVLCVMLLVALLNTFTAPRAEVEGELDAYRKPGDVDSEGLPRVSLLVPARNEAHNVPILAEYLARLDYPHLEIILLDDASEDGTGAALDALVQHVGRTESVSVRSIRGAPLPSHWLGKNWACHQLAQVSTGDVLIFCDADARPGPRAVRRTVNLMARYRAGCATIMPRQILGSWAERAVIPVLLHISLFCFLPLALVPRLPWKRIAVGNGQWLAFSRKTYAAIGGHVAVRDKVVEDIALAQRAQESRQGLVVALGPRTLDVRMYRSVREVWDGFGKNVFVVTGGSFLTAPLFGGFFALIHILPWLLFVFNPALWLTPLLLLIVCRVLTARALGETPRALLGQIAGSLLVPLIAARSLLNNRRKRLLWKGRLLNTTAAPVTALPDTNP